MENNNEGEDYERRVEDLWKRGFPVKRICFKREQRKEGAGRKVS